MDIFDINNFQFVSDDPDVLMRIKNPRYDSEITFLTTNGKTMDSDQLWRIDQIGVQWFVIINTPLFDKKIAESIQKNGDEYGIELAQFLPMSFIMHGALEEIVDKYTTDDGGGNQ